MGPGRRLGEDAGQMLAGMKRIAVICEEKTEYTLDIVNAVYLPRGVDVYWRRELKVKDIIAIYRGHDVVVVNGYTGWDYWFGFIVNAWGFRRIVGIDSDSQPEEPKNRLRRQIKTALLKWLYSQPWCWGLAGGTGVHRKAFMQYGMPETRIVLNPMVSRKHLAGDEPKRKPGFSFGYVGRLVPHKQVAGILQAWTQAAIPEASMVVIGDGVDKARLEQDYPEVQFTGKLSGAELAEVMAGLDCLVLWSAYEPWGLVVNEALAFGVPVIVSDKVGAREDLVEGKGTGIVVAHNDLPGLVEAMRRMHQEAATMRGNCLKTADKWDLNFHARCWDKWIEALP